MRVNEAGVFRVHPDWKICLLSSSPRREALLASLGISFDIHPVSDCERPPLSGEGPRQYAQTMANLKLANAPQQNGNIAYIAADTVVASRGQILGKPSAIRHALAMLEELNGRRHQVITAFEIGLPGGAKMPFYEESDVYFGQWPTSTLAAYASCGEGLDKAGAYAIQGLGGFLVDRIEGSYSNIVGLPLGILTRALLEEGIIMPNLAQSF